MPGRAHAPHTLTELLTRFAALSDDKEPVRHIRGIALAVAQDWFIRLPDSPAKDEALSSLAVATQHACEAVQGG